MGSTPFARKKLCFHICLHNEVRYLSNIYNHIFVYINHNDTIYSDNKLSAQRMIEFTNENSNQKYM